MGKKLAQRLVSLGIAGAMMLSVPLGALADTYDLTKGDITVTVEKRTDAETGEEKEDVWVKQTSTEEDGTEKEYLSKEATEELKKKQNNSDEQEEQVEVPENTENTNITKVGYTENQSEEDKEKEEKDAIEKAEKENSEKQESEPASRVYDKVKGLLQTSAVKIKQSNSNTSTSNTITIEAKDNTTAEVTLDNVNIEAKAGTAPQVSGAGEAAITVKAEEGSTVVLELDGQNTVKSGFMHAGVEKSRVVKTTADVDAMGFGYNEKTEKDPTGALIIQDKSGDKGSLNATGGEGGAGIGGCAIDGASATANIEINGCIVVAQGGNGAAGIGGGYAGSFNYDNGTPRNADAENIKIINAIVTATGGQGGVSWAGNSTSAGAGIGGGRTGDAYGIYIENSTVKANGGEAAAGIGGGAKTETAGTDEYYRGGDCDGITIITSNVNATGGSLGAGIGGGGSGDVTGAITIGGGEVTANGGQRGAGIGSGSGGDVNGTISITGGNVTAKGGTDGGSGIGSGRKAFYTIVNGQPDVGRGGDVNGSILIGGNTVVNAYGGTSTTSEYGAGIGAGSKGSVNEGAQIVVKDNAQVTAVSANDSAASIGAGGVANTWGAAGAFGQNNGAIKLLNKAKVILGVGTSTSSSETGYIGSGKYTVATEDHAVGEAVADGSAATYEVDCTATINGNEVESTYRPDMSKTEWLWDSIKTYIHYTPGSIADNNGVYTNGNLTINCVDEINAYNSGAIRSDDPAAQRWYWVTALFDADENVGYTYEQIGSNLIINTDEQAYGAVLHVLLSGWAEHTEVQSITFVTAGKTTTLYASEMLGITTGEQLTLTHDYDKATLAVEGRDYTYLLGEQAA